MSRCIAAFEVQDERFAQAFAGPAIHDQRQFAICLGISACAVCAERLQPAGAGKMELTPACVAPFLCYLSAGNTQYRRSKTACHLSRAGYSVRGAPWEGRLRAHEGYSKRFFDIPCWRNVALPTN